MMILVWGRCVAFVPNTNVLFFFCGKCALILCCQPTCFEEMIHSGCQGVSHDESQSVSQSAHSIFLAVVTDLGIGPRSKSGPLGSIRPYSVMVGTVLQETESPSPPLDFFVLHEWEYRRLGPIQRIPRMKPSKRTLS